MKAGDAVVLVSDLYFCDDPLRRMEADENKLVLMGVTARFEGAKDARDREQGAPQAEKTVRWLVDCAHLSSQYVLHFGSAGLGAARSWLSLLGTAR